MVGLIIILIAAVAWVWISYELWRAPVYDEYMNNIIIPTRKLLDLFKKKKQ